MKSLIIFIIAAFAITNTFAQKQLNTFFEQYEALENINTLNLQGSILNLVSNNAKSGKKALTKLEGISAIWAEDFNPISQRDVRHLMRSLKKDQFEELIMLKDGSTNVNFLIQENGNTITGVILLLDDTDQFLLIHLKGSLEYSELRDLDIDMEGIEYFKKLPRNRKRV